MSRQNRDLPGPGDGVAHAVKAVKSFTVAVSWDQFTDGGSTLGGYTLPYSIPKDAYVLGVQVKIPTAFGPGAVTGGVGTDADPDRYMTGTIDFAVAAQEGVAAGPPSGARFHTQAEAPVLVLAHATDWTSVNAGQLIITVYYV